MNYPLSLRPMQPHVHKQKSNIWFNQTNIRLANRVIKFISQRARYQMGQWSPSKAAWFITWGVQMSQIVVPAAEGALWHGLFVTVKFDAEFLCLVKSKTCRLWVFQLMFPNLPENEHKSSEVSESCCGTILEGLCPVKFSIVVLERRWSWGQETLDFNHLITPEKSEFPYPAKFPCKYSDTKGCGGFSIPQDHIGGIVSCEIHCIEVPALGRRRGFETLDFSHLWITSGSPNFRFPRNFHASIRKQKITAVNFVPSHISRDFIVETFRNKQKSVYIVRFRKYQANAWCQRQLMDYDKCFGTVNLP